MSEPENAVARWSRLKREAETGKTRTPEPGKPIGLKKADEPASNPSGGAVQPHAGKPSSPAFDPASLPPIESITATSDIRAFLQAGVPSELTKAALRRAWSADPAIRDFIGLAENQWDFTDPASIHGFGTLEGSAEQLRELVSQAMGDLQDAAGSLAEGQPVPEQSPAPAAVASEAAQAAGMTDGIPEKAESRDSLGEEQSGVDVAAQHGGAPVEKQVGVNRRGHGRALPQ